MTLEEIQSTVDQWIRSFGQRYFNELTNTAESAAYSRKAYFIPFSWDNAEKRSSIVIKSSGAGSTHDDIPAVIFHFTKLFCLKIENNVTSRVVHLESNGIG
jgi:hypothetical protein